MPTFDEQEVISRLTRERLRSYLEDCSGDDHAALELYTWNARVSAALHEDIGRFEVIFRNTIDASLRTYVKSRGWSSPWYMSDALLSAKRARRARESVNQAHQRAERYGTPPSNGQIIAELNFGFWRFLCRKSYLTSMWVPVLAEAFPNHPAGANARQVREDVEHHVARAHTLRNRIAHHEPIHRRNLRQDFESIATVAGWMNADARSWIESTSRTLSVLDQRASE